MLIKYLHAYTGRQTCMTDVSMKATLHDQRLWSKVVLLIVKKECSPCWCGLQGGCNNGPYLCLVLALGVCACLYGVRVCTFKEFDSVCRLLCV